MDPVRRSSVSGEGSGPRSRFFYSAMRFCFVMSLFRTRGELRSHRQPLPSAHTLSAYSRRSRVLVILARPCVYLRPASNYRSLFDSFCSSGSLVIGRKNRSPTTRTLLFWLCRQLLSCYRPLLRWFSTAVAWLVRSAVQMSEVYTQRYVSG